MKKSLQIFALLFCIIISAQAPEKFSYQAVIRNASNTVITNAPVGIKISILKTSNTGTVVYSESQTANTNSNGLISLQIGDGSVISGSIATIDWSADSYFIKTEVDPSGGSSYTVVGTSQLLSVPYAMFAKTSGNGSTFTLPYAGTSAANNVTPFKITNSGSSQNSAGIFENTDAANGEAALLGINNSMGNFGAGVEGRAQSNSNGNTSSGVRGYLLGTGTAGAGVLGNAQNADGVYGSTTNGTGVRGSANGTGTGGAFNSGATGHSLITNGPLQLTNISEGAGKVLTSDAAGNATWQALATGSSTWVTTGTNISNTNTGNVGIGTSNPGTILTVKYNGQGFSQESLNGGVEAGFYVDDASAYVQTHTNTDLDFTTNNGLRQMTLQKGTGNLGIGTAVPTEKLEVNGKTKTTNLQVTNGAAASKVLTSDASGNATWQNPTGGLTLPYAATNSSAGTSFGITNDNGGNAITGYSPGGIGLNGLTSSGKGVFGSGNTGTGVEGSSASGIAGYFSSTSGLALKTGTGGTEINGNLKISSGAPGVGKVLTSDATGNATWSNAPIGFTVRKTLAQSIPVNVATKIIFGNDGTQQGNSYSFPNSNFTVSTAGYYKIDATLDLQNDPSYVSSSGDIAIVITVNGLSTYTSRYPRGTTTLGDHAISALINLQIGDIVDIRVLNQSSSPILVYAWANAPAYSYFSAYKAF